MGEASGLYEVKREKGPSRLSVLHQILTPFVTLGKMTPNEYNDFIKIAEDPKEGYETATVTFDSDVMQALDKAQEDFGIDFLEPFRNSERESSQGTGFRKVVTIGKTTGVGTVYRLNMGEDPKRRAMLYRTTALPAMSHWMLARDDKPAPALRVITGGK